MMKHEVRYPFVRSSYTVWDEDGCSELPCWRPGTKPLDPPVVEYDQNGHGVAQLESYSEGEGVMILQLVKHVVLPRPYQTRVFFKRWWRDPDGREWGKPLLRCMTEKSYLALLSGYRFPYLRKD